MFMPDRNRTPWLADLLARLAQYRPAPPLPGLLSEETWRLPFRATDRDAGNPRPVVLARNEPSNDSDNLLSDGVVNQFRDRLDSEGLRFLKSGPVTPDEKRAYTQRIRSDAHLSATMAPADLQRRFQDTGRFDIARYFAGPDGTLYVRNASSREMLAQRLRRGLQRAVNGKAPPTSPPIPPEIMLSRTNDTYRKFKNIISDARYYGLDHAADALEHFLEGGGAPVNYDYREFLQSPTARAAEATINQHIAHWMLGTHPKKFSSKARVPVYVESGLNQIKGDLLAMKDGDTTHRGDRWDAVLPYSKLDLGWQASAPNRSPPAEAADWYGVTGDAQLGSGSGFDFRRVGDRIEFKGAANYNFDETFNFENDWRFFPAPAREGILPWILRQGEGVELQEKGLGKPYQTTSYWDRSITGTLRINPDGTLELERIDWGDPYRRLSRR